jgi:hypothetical protein
LISFRLILAYIQIVLTNKGISGVEIPDPEAFVDRILSLITQNQTDAPPEWSEADLASFISYCFSCLLYGSIQDEAIWSVCERSVDLHHLIGVLLLAENRMLLRRLIADVLLHVCQSQQETNATSVNTTLAHNISSVVEALWTAIVSVLFSVTEWRENSEALFSVSVSLLRAVLRGPSPLALDLPSHIAKWSHVLVEYQPFQVCSDAINDGAY